VTAAFNVSRWFMNADPRCLIDLVFFHAAPAEGRRK
jgi:hypothetical protein